MAVHLSGDEKLPRTGGIALAMLSTAGLWFCVLGSKAIGLLTSNDSWRMPHFLERALVHLTAGTWVFMGISLTSKTLKLVLAGVNWISSSGCHSKQKRSQHSWEFLSMEDQDFTPMIAVVFLQCSVTDTAPNTVCSIPEEQHLESEPILTVHVPDPSVGLCRGTVIWK